MQISINKKNIFSVFFLLFIAFTGLAQQSKGNISVETNTKIDEVIAQKKQYNKNLKSVKGYRIQLFYGNEKESYKIKDEFKLLFPEVPTKIIFSSPQWKVQVGSFETRLEADRALIPIKKEYSGAIILATEIELE